jgi:hypothetical protein
MQGSFFVLDAEGLATKKLSGREKGATNYSSVELVALHQLSLKFLMPLIAVIVPLSRKKFSRGRLPSSTSLIKVGFPVLCMGVLWTYTVLS